MTLEQFETACGNTLALLKSRNPVGEPRRDEDQPTFPHHLSWMLIQAALFYSEGRTDKANRWLGYVQGVMAALHLASLEELKRANMPEGSEFDGGRAMRRPVMRIGQEFTAPPDNRWDFSDDAPTFHNTWRVTDVGSRTFLAISVTEALASHASDDDPASWLAGPPYAVVEHVFDETDYARLAEVDGIEWVES